MDNESQAQPLQQREVAKAIKVARELAPIPMRKRGRNEKATDDEAGQIVMTRVTKIVMTRALKI